MHNISFEDWQKRIQNGLGKENWIVVYADIKSKYEVLSIYSALIPNDRVKTALRKKSWDIYKGGGQPGFGQHAPKFETVYLRFGNFDNIEPFIYYRYFYDIKQSYIEVSQEFIHYFNLYKDTLNGRYIEIEKDGNEENIIIMNEQEIKVKLINLKKYLAIKNSHLAIYFDIWRRSERTLEELGLKNKKEVITGEKYIYFLDIANSPVYSTKFKEQLESSSRLLGKKLIEGLQDFKPSLWEEYNKECYLDFIVGIDDDGKELYKSCNPHELEPSKYLLPVFFKREVLAKYYNRPEKYTIGDNYISCKSLWGLNMDNNHEDYIVVFLGDLGGSLSYKEQMY